MIGWEKELFFERMLKLKKLDKILIVVLLFFAAGLYFSGILRPHGAGVRAIISVGGKEYTRISLEEEKELIIEQNGKKNIIVVEGGMAFMKEASCPDQICIRQGKIKKKNETVVCLPNQVLIEIEGGQEELDAVAQ